MSRLTAILVIVCAIAAGATQAGVPIAVTDDDWIAAAKTALAAVDRRQQSVIVMESSLSPAAQTALIHLRNAMYVDQLPDSEHYEQPPGHYLRVRRFQLDGNRFEFMTTSGVIPQKALLNCGETLHFFVARIADGAWQIDGLMTSTVC